MRGGKGSILRRSRRERQRHLRETRSNCRKWGGRQSWRQVSGSANGSRGSGHGKTRHLGIVSGGWTEGKVASIYTRLSESRLIAGCVISLSPVLLLNSAISGTIRPFGFYRCFAAISF